MALYLYNTLTRKKEKFKPITPGKVGVYTCGPTVYYPMHIGNIRAYANWDILHRSLKFLGYEVDRYINLTDVGHMTADADFGEDKIEEAAKKEGRSPLDVSNYYIGTVMKDFAALNYLHPDGSLVGKTGRIGKHMEHGWLRATDHVEEMIEMNKSIEANGYTYETDQALYYDVSKFGDYTKFSGQKLEDKLVAVRDEVNIDPDKRHPADFVLWMKRVGKYEKHLQHWDSPWGDGFPGWHIECSAMGTKYLGENFDIHTGGIDHIPVHHSNEIAQNFGAHKHPVVNYWLHNEFLTSKDGKKLSKSKGNSWDLEALEKEGFNPLDLRYYLISIHYRQPIALSREALQGARNSRLKVMEKLRALKIKSGGIGCVIDERVDLFKATLEDDLNVSMAFAALFDLLSAKEKAEDILMTVLEFDKVFGLKLDQAVGDLEVPDRVRKLMKSREEARAKKDFALSDELRDKIDRLGYTVKDRATGQEVNKK